MFNRVKIKEKFGGRMQEARGWFERNEKYLTIGFFSLGLIIDALTFRRVDLVFGNLVLFFHLSLATFGVILLYTAETQRRKKYQSWLVRNSKYVPLMTQYAFGGLFSGYIIFYTKSASWATSWIFLFLLIAFFIGNERFRQKYKKIDFQINILFVAIFSFMIFFVPVILKVMGAWVFVLSGILSVILIYLLIYSLSCFISKIRPKREKRMMKSILGIFLLFNILYFLNIIPPIPLSLKEIGVYDFVRRDTSGDYILVEKELPWYSFGNYLLRIPEGRVYVYQSIFAPTDLNTDIYNIWQRFDDDRRRWVSLNEVHFSLLGGRDEGYRGYSFMSDISEGLWRVDVKTREGLVVGRIKFRVVGE